MRAWGEIKGLWALCYRKSVTDEVFNVQMPAQVAQGLGHQNGTPLLGDHPNRYLIHGYINSSDAIITK